jgi:outer membrane immunogenic protein
MKKIALALTISSAITGSAAAADVATPTYVKAVPAAVTHNWTGVYVFGGAGAGLWGADSNVQSRGFFAIPAGSDITRDQRFGGLGWFGTVGLGYDWQLGNKWVIGLFGDGQFGDIHGSLSHPIFTTEGRESLRASYAGGARVGYLIAPNVLSYVNAGYSGSQWSGTNQSIIVPSIVPGGTNLASTPSFWRDGVFIGGGVENNLDIFGVTAPGWFMKTEYRSAFYGRATLPVNVAPIAGAGPIGTAVTFKPWTQTISTSLVYRFN